MGLTNSWDESIPDGSVLTVAGIDDAVRYKALAVRERLEGDPADPDLTGLIEVGSFTSAPKPRKGTARVYVDTEANILAYGATKVEDGRLAWSTDTKRLFHLPTGGTPEVIRSASVIGAFAFPSTGTAWYSAVWTRHDRQTESEAQIPCPIAGVVSKLYATMLMTGGPAEAITVMLRKNGADTALTCTFGVSASAGDVTSDLTHSVSVAAGDLLNIKTSLVTGPFAGTFAIVFTAVFES